MDALLLARMQFALNISFHILFPTITIALCWVLLFFRLRWLRTRDESWLKAYQLWTKVFALSFAIGVVSGIPMSFQFGTNWPGFMERAGNIAGPLLGYEVLTAFFLEASFLGVMLYGHQRVSERVHVFATLMVAIGTTSSAFWILSLNSWMQTPTGYEVVNGEFFVKDWLAIVFNPSFPYRLSHVLLASGLTVAFLMVGFSAYQLWRKVESPATAKTMRVGLTLAALLIPLQIFVGDLHGLNTLEHQPQKIAAMEGLWETQSHASLLLFAIPDQEKRQNDFEVGIPGMASVILTHDRNGVVRGLNEFEGQHPPVAPVFWGFRVMVGMGFLMLFTSWFGAWYLRRRQWQIDALPKPVLAVFIGMTFSGWIATLAGWYVTEIGRQPFIIYGLVRIDEVVANVAPEKIVFSLSAYGLVYAFLLVAFVTVVMRLMLKAGNPLHSSKENPAHAESLGSTPI